jgi:tRNA (guanine-N7-)-methyltransferase
MEEPATSEARRGDGSNIPVFVAERRQARVLALRDRLESLLPTSGSVVVEFGCGHGHWLTAYAEAHPHVCCVGLDLLSARVRKAEAKGAKRDLPRLRFLKAEATEFLEAWPTNRRIDAVFMLFPDPWPKKRHHKNRMVQAAFLDRLAAVVRGGGRFHFRTDDAAYFEWTEALLAEHPAWALDGDLPWPWETPTLFQNFMASWSSLIAVRGEAAGERSEEPQHEGELGGEGGEKGQPGEPEDGVEGHRA